MPKIVDETARQQAIGQAVWRIAETEGLHQATVRRVAEEAGLSVGSLRRSFPTQASLYEYAMALIIERLEGRLGDGREIAQVAPLEQVVILLKNFLPLGDEQATEMRVWLSFSAEAQHSVALRSLNDSMFDRTRGYMVSVLQYLVEQEVLAEDIDLNKEAGALHAFLDGLTLHCLLRPEMVTEEKVDEALRSYFDRMIA